MKRSLLVLLVAASAACARAGAPPSPSPFASPPVSPMTARSTVVVDERFREQPPAPLADTAPLELAVRAFTLPNGLQSAVVERRAFPTITVRLELGFPGDSGDVDRRAYVLGRLFLLPTNAREATAVGCSSEVCSVVVNLVRDDLGPALTRLASRIFGEGDDAGALGRRLALVDPSYALSAGDPGTAASRNVAALLFGYDNPYAGPSGQPKTLTLDVARQWRAAAFAPARSRLIVVGDVSAEQVEADARAAFGRWSGPRTPANSSPVPPLPGDSRIAIVPMRNLSDILGYIAVRGPGHRHPDAVPFDLARRVVAAAYPSSSPPPCNARAAAIATDHLRVPVAAYRDVSSVVIGGVFEPSAALDGIAAFLRSIRALRDELVSDEALGQAKRRATADWRSGMGTNDGIASRLASALGTGGVPADVLEAPARIARVSAEDVRRVARIYFAEDALRVAFVGDSSRLGGVQDLSLGGARMTDGFGRYGEMRFSKK